MRSLLAAAVIGVATPTFAAQTHYFPFNANGKDASGNANHGTLFGASSITTPGQRGPGTLTVTDTSGVQLPVFQRPPALTFAAWVNIDTIRSGSNPGPEAFLLSMVTNGTNAPNYQVRVNGGSGVLQIGQWNGTVYQAFNSSGAGGTGGPGSTLNLINTANPNPPGWVHVAAIYNDTGNEKLYLNGSMVVEGNLTNGLPGTVQYVALGKLNTGPSSHLPQGMNGRMDEVRLFDAALTDAQILELFNRGFVLGDMNGDGIVNNQDIAPFVSALTNYPSYVSAFPNLDGLALGDTNLDGDFNNQDIAPFVALLTTPGGVSEGDLAPLLSLVPEPGSLSLLALGGLAMRRRR